MQIIRDCGSDETVVECCGDDFDCVFGTTDQMKSEKKRMPKQDKMNMVRKAFALKDHFVQGHFEQRRVFCVSSFSTTFRGRANFGGAGG
jgi:hypothetical protein